MDWSSKDRKIRQQGSTNSGGGVVYPRGGPLPAERWCLASKKDYLPEGYWSIGKQAALHRHRLVSRLWIEFQLRSWCSNKLFKSRPPGRFLQSECVCIPKDLTRRSVQGATNPTAKWAEIKLNLNWEICYTQNGFRIRSRGGPHVESIALWQIGSPSKVAGQSE